MGGMESALAGVTHLGAAESYVKARGATAKRLGLDRFSVAPIVVCSASAARRG